MKIQIDCFDKYPMERRPKYQRWVAELVVLEGDPALAKSVTRKTRDAAYAIATKWYHESLAAGLEVRAGTGTAFY